MSFITDFFKELAQSAINLINGLLVDLLDIVLNSQDYMTNHLGIEGIDFNKINSIVLTYALGWIVFKFLQKGFNIYILQSDGDPEHDPMSLLTGFFEAIAISITAIELYPYIIDFFKKFTKDILKAMGSDGELQAIESTVLNNLFGQGLASTLLVCIFAILTIILYITFIKDGFEMMIIKYGFPFFAGGLMDSDGGSFKTACKKFLQVGFTAALKTMLLRLAIALMLTLHPIWAIAACVTAITSPKILQEFLFIRQGGGATSKLYAMSSLKNMFIK